MKKFIFFTLFALAFIALCFSQNVTVTVNITNVEVNGGTVHIAIFANAEEFRREIPSYAFQLPARSSTVSLQVTLPAGDYVVSAFQDLFGNGIVTYRRLGLLPNEPVAISNYDGRGIPTKNFDRQKIRIDRTTGSVTIGLFRF